MKNLIKALTIGAALIGASAAYAIPSSGTIDIAKGAYRNSSMGGGEFDATIGTNNFITFCVERYQSLSAYLPGTFDYTLDDNMTSTGNAVSAGTVWLFRQFTAGTLTGYDFANAVSRSTSAETLQMAMWNLDGYAGALDVGNQFVALAVAHFGNATNARAASTDYTVKVVQVWGSENEDRQDVLVYVPDSGSTLILLGLGLAGMALLRRRFI